MTINIHNTGIKHICSQRRSLVLSLFLMILSSAFAQYRIQGTVMDGVSFEVLPSSSVQLFTSDSTYLSGAVTDDKGHFNLTTDKKADYHVVVSYIGYTKARKKFSLQSKTTLLGTIMLQPDSILLDEATVIANLPKVQIVEDTIMYNASAYKVPEGGVLDELLEQIPGAEVTEEGITINGKKVERITVNGKEFFLGNLDAARKNLPVDIIDKLKFYEEQSEQAKVTGIDDGAYRPTIDIKLKKGMDLGYQTNGDVGYGTHDRYTGRISASSFTSKQRLTAVGNGSNLSGGRGGGGQGLRTSQSAGLSYNYDDKGENGRKESMLKMDGSVNWNHGTTDNETRTNSENWEKVGARTYSNSLSDNLSRNHGWNANFRLEWRPDTLTNIQFRPTWSYSSNDNTSRQQSMQFSDDPFGYTDAPLGLYENFDDVDNIRTNRRINQSLSHSESKSLGGSLQYNRRWGNMGRNLNLRVEANKSSSDNTSISNNYVHLYKVMDRFGNDSVYYTNRYNLTPSDKWNYSLSTSYSEPLMRGTFLQFSYNFNHSENTSDRKTYDFSELGEDFGHGATVRYGGFDDFLYDIDDMEYYLDDTKSKYAKYVNNNHDAQLLFRMIRTFYNFSTGIRFQPQHTHFTQQYLGYNVDTTRFVTNFNPTLDLNIRFSRQHNLRLRYNGNSSQPSITDLIDIWDDTNPLNITHGNPGLRPSFTNNFNVEWNDYLQKTGMQFNFNWRYSTTHNSVSRIVSYDDATGGRISRPENINGNWNTGGRLGFSTPLDEKKLFNVSVSSEFQFRNQVSYITVNRNEDSKRNITKNTTVGPRVEGSFHNTWLHVNLNGRLNYSHVRNMLMSSANRDTYEFSYGGSVNVTLPWEMQINTSLNETSRRGHTDAQANTNQLIWNATVTQSLLKQRRLQLQLQMFDILGQRKNFNYRVGDTSINETYYNSITQYAMLHVIFNFRAFGGKSARQERRDRREAAADGMTTEGERPEFEGRRPEGRRPEGNRGNWGGNRGGGFGGGNRGGRN